MGSKEAETNWVSIPMAARILGIGTPTVESLIEAGRLTVRRIPPSYARVLRSEVEALAESSTTAAGARS